MFLTRHCHQFDAPRFFGRCSILARLLQARLALPLLHPLVPGQLRDHKQVVAESPYQPAEVQASLGFIQPYIAGLTQVTKILRGTHALAHFSNRRRRSLFEPRTLKSRRRMANYWPTFQRTAYVANKTGIGHGHPGSGLPIDAVTRRLRLYPTRREIAEGPTNMQMKKKMYWQAGAEAKMKVRYPRIRTN